MVVPYEGGEHNMENQKTYTANKSTHLHTNKISTQIQIVFRYQTQYYFRKTYTLQTS